MGCKCCIGFGGDGNACARGDIVKNEWNITCIRDACIHVDQPLLGRLVIIGSHDKRRFIAKLFCKFRNAEIQIDRVRGIIGACACDHGHALCGTLIGEAQDLSVLLVCQGRALTRCARNHERVDAVFDLPIDQLSKCLEVYKAILHRCDKGSRCALKDRFLYHDIFLSAFGFLSLIKEKGSHARCLRTVQNCGVNGTTCPPVIFLDSPPENLSDNSDNVLIGTRSNVPCIRLRQRPLSACSSVFGKNVALRHSVLLVRCASTFASCIV